MNRFYDIVLKFSLLKADIDIRIIGSDWWRKNYTGSDLPLDTHFHRRDHAWSTSELRERVLEASK